jgi:hypothetical protein
MLAGSIAYGKLSLTGAILNADLAGSIALSKLSISGTADGSKYLRDDGSWATVSAGVTPGGSDTELQFNSGGSALGGAAALTYVAAGPHLTITSLGAAIKPLIVKGAASQSANLIEIQNSGGTALASISSAGNVTTPVVSLSGVAGGAGANGSAGAAAGNSGEVQYNSSGSFAGGSGLVYATSGTNVLVTAQAASDKPLIVKAAASQSANLFEIQNSSSTALVSVSSAGAITGDGSGLTTLNATNLSSGTVATARLGTGTADSTTYLRGDGSWATPSGGGGASGDIQTFTSSGTWTKPGSGTIAMIECIGGGGSGGKRSSGSGAGGGGGGYNIAWKALSSLGATETVTVGAGGAAQSANSTNGNAGGNSTFGAHLTAYGGGGGGQGSSGGTGGSGGGQTSAGGTASVTPGGPLLRAEACLDDGYSSCTVPNIYQGSGGTTAVGSSIAGTSGVVHGGGGGSKNIGGGSIYGGGGGGPSYGGAGGGSVYGGAGGAGGTPGVAGTQPGGGGGGSNSGNSGAGGAGLCKVMVF